MRASVQVQGLAALRRDLRRAERTDDLRELREGFKDAADVAVRDAKGRVPSRSGRARDAIRSRAGGNKAYIVGGKNSVPYYGWLDFGSRNPQTGNPRSRGPWAGSGSGPQGGRFIYPAIEANQEEMVRAITHALDRALNRLDLPST